VSASNTANTSTHRDFSTEDHPNLALNKQDLVRDVGRHGGRRTGQMGRPVGSRNKRTQELLDAVTTSGQTPLDYLLSVMRNAENDTSVRIDAAKAALPYVHPRLHGVAVSSNNSKPIPLAAPIPVTGEYLAQFYKQVIDGIH
jgi:hypothetical protein